MSDPFDSLKRSGDELVDRPLPAAEVRRLGDRRRRRRTGARVLGAAVAVAVVATGGVALGTSRPDATPPPAATQDASPTPDATAPATPNPEPGPDPGPDPGPLDTTIPARFPLAAGYPAVVVGSDEQELVGPGAEVSALSDIRACGRLVHPTGEPADRLAVRFQQPEDFRSRELTTYPSVAAARAVLSSLVTGHQDCPREADAGTSGPATNTEVRQTDLGEEGYVVVQTYESGGYSAVGLGQLHVVRVGNAVLLASTSTEGSPQPRAVDRAVSDESTALRPVVAAMCTFATDGCEADTAGELGYATLTLSDVRELVGEPATTWRLVPTQSSTPTLGCQSDWLGSLGPSARGFRSFLGHDGRGDVTAEAATAVLGFSDEAAAAAAYETVSGWIRACDDPMPSARPVETTYDVVQTGTDGADRVLWRVVESRADEVCTGCDTRWVDSQGVALVGSRVVVLSLASLGAAGSGADAGVSPMPEGLDLAARLAAY